MDRYDFLLGRKPENIPIEKSLDYFSFENDNIDPIIRAPFYRPSSDRFERIGIVFNDPNKVFVSSYVHYDIKGKIFIKCKKDICCNAPHRWPKRALKIACVIIKYGEGFITDGNHQMYIWSMGKKVYDDLKFLNNSFSLLESDILVKSDVSSFRIILNFPKISNSQSLWQNHQKELIDSVASPLIYNLKNYICRDFTLQKLKEMSKEKIFD